MSSVNWQWMVVGGVILIILGRTISARAKSRTMGGRTRAWRLGAAAMVLGEALVVGGLAVWVVELVD
jgi:uncharacterized membrane protein HdeD (DUF308 family)